MYSMGCPPIRVLVRFAVLTAALLAGAATPAAASLGGSLAAELASVGGSNGEEVMNLGTGHILFSSARNSRRIPASVEKLYTTSTALAQFGASGRLQTRIFARGSVDSHGHFHGILYLRGGGDPTFGSASYDRYAYGTGATVQNLVANLRARTGITEITGAIVGDGSYLDSRPGTPATGYAVSSYDEGVLSGLAYDRGFADEQGASFQNNPPLFAAQRLLDALRAGGITVPSGIHVRTGQTPSGLTLAAAVHSPTMAKVIQLTNTPSDNYMAEMLVKDLGAAAKHRGTTSTGAAVVRARLASRFGIHPSVVDGSGLSYNDRTSPSDVITLLRGLRSDSAFVHSLAVAGESGTIQAGLAGTSAQGRCQGKTGTLSNVASLVGYCTTKRGHRLAFAFLENGVDPTAGHASEYRMTVDLVNSG